MISSSLSCGRGFGRPGGRRNHFAGIAKTLRVQGRLDAAHRFDIGFPEDQRHLHQLLRADPVLPADGPAEIGANLEDLAPRLVHPRQLVVVAIIEEDQRVEVAVPGMEDVPDGELVFLGDPFDGTRASGSFVRGTVPSQTR